MDAHELYNRMLHRIIREHRNFVQEIAFLLHCVTLAKRPLTLEALQILVPQKDQNINEWIQELVAMSCGFLELQSSGDGSSDIFVVLVHPSAKNYLVASLGRELKEFWIVKEDMHYEIAERSLTCLETNWVQAGKPHFEAWKKPIAPDQTDLVHYALEFWHYHARDCGVYAEKIFDTNRLFFGTDFNPRMYWTYSGFGTSPIDPVVGLDLSQANFLWQQNHLSAIHVASLLGNVPWFNSLIHRSGMHILNSEDGFKVTPLQYASLGGHAEAVRLIIDYTSMAQYGRALWFAIITGSTDVVRLLLNKGANVDCHLETNRELVELACTGDDDDEYDMQARPKFISLLLKAIEDCNQDIVSVLLEKGSSLVVNGQSAIAYAKAYGGRAIHRMLVECQNARSNEGRGVAGLGASRRMQ